MLRTLYMNKLMLYSTLCRIIIFIYFNFWSVVRVVFGKIKFSALMCRKFKYLFEDIATSVPND